MNTREIEHTMFTIYLNNLLTITERKPDCEEVEKTL
jgi:hypothetical protein